MFLERLLQLLDLEVQGEGNMRCTEDYLRKSVSVALNLDPAKLTSYSEESHVRFW